MTPEVKKAAAEDEMDSKKARLMKKNRRKFKETQRSSMLTDAVKETMSEATEDDTDTLDLPSASALDDDYMLGEGQPLSPTASNASSSPNAKKPRTYFRRTNNKIPDLLLSEYMKR